MARRLYNSIFEGEEIDEILSQAINKLNINLNPEGVYGLQADFTNKVFTRLGDCASWSMGDDFTNNSFYGSIKRCCVADNGKVNAYYGETNYKEDGTNGQVMVEIPKFYYRVIPLETEAIDSLTTVMRKGQYYVSPTAQQGFSVHPAFLRDGQEIDFIYYGAFEGCIYDTSAATYSMADSASMDTSTDKFSSIAGAKPASGISNSLTRTAIEQMANNRGLDWHCAGILEASAVQLLMAIEMGNFNAQTMIGQGVTGITDNTSYSCTSLTGSTFGLGNSSGSADSSINTIGDTSTTYTDANKTSVSWRGIENFWGNIWEHIQGMTISGNGSQKGGKPYICMNRAYSDSNVPANYQAVNFCIPNAGNYISAFGYDPNFDWLFIPGEATGATSALPVGDYVWLATDLNGYRTARLGAHWNDGLRAGPFCWSLDNGLGHRYRYIGGRLVLCSAT